MEVCLDVLRCPYLLQSFGQASIDVLPQILYEFNVEAWTNCVKGWSSKMQEAFRQKRMEESEPKQEADS